MNPLQRKAQILESLNIPSLVKIDDKNYIMKVNSKWDLNISLVRNSDMWEAKSEGKSYMWKKALEVPADVKEIIQTVVEPYNDALMDAAESNGNEPAKDSLDNLKDAGFEIPEEAPIVDQPKEEARWSKPAPKTQTKYEEVPAEIVSLPAPVGVSGIVRPAVTAAEALAAWNEFQALKNYIIEKSDIQVIQGKNHIKKSGWRKFATFYNLTDQIVEENQFPLEKGGFYWKIKVVCTAPNGRQTEGVGMCSSLEKSGARVLHDTYTTAHTRAKNRAISDMIAAGEVSAEEMA
jgi:hypothetical protein